MIMDIIPATYSKIVTKYTTFANYLLIVDDYSKITKLCGVENITTDEVMNKLDTFQERFVKVDEFGCWDMERIQTDTATQLTSKEFQEGLYVYRVRLKLAAPDHQEINDGFEVTWLTLLTTAH